MERRGRNKEKKKKSKHRRSSQPNRAQIPDTITISSSTHTLIFRLRLSSDFIIIDQPGVGFIIIILLQLVYRLQAYGEYGVIFESKFGDEPRGILF